MIPAIGLMIGFYVITRMMELSGRPDQKKSIRLMAALTIIVNVLGILILLGSGSQVPNL